MTAERPSGLARALSRLLPWAPYGVLSLPLLPALLAQRTLYFRDVGSFHLPVKIGQSEAWRQGSLPLVDLWRAGGQASLANPDTLPLYPTNLLVLLDPVWGVNLHFWLHLPIAGLAVAWLASELGLARGAARVAGLLFVASGLFFSLFNLYNLIAAWSLAPAAVASSLRSARTGRGVGSAVALWGLLALAGDPVSLLLALGLLAASLVTRDRGGDAAAAAGNAPAHRPAAVASGIAGGLLLALPQLVALLGLLPGSFRGVQRFSLEGALVGSWDPRQSLDLLLPLFSGPPPADRFWGLELFGGEPPLLFAFSPGLLALLLIAAAAGRLRLDWSARAALLLIGAGLFFALGVHNPVVRWLTALPGAGLLRLPTKFGLWVELGVVLLAAQSLWRLRQAGAWRGLSRLAAAAGSLYLGSALLLAVAPALVAPWVDHLAGHELPSEVWTVTRLRWLRQSLGLGLFGVLLALLARRWRRTGGFERSLPLLLVVHAGLQTWLLLPLVATAPRAVLEAGSPLAARLPPGTRIVHGPTRSLFSRPAPRRPRGAGDDWYLRWSVRSMAPVAGVQRGLRYELNPAPDGLDSFLVHAAAQAMPRLAGSSGDGAAGGDAARLRLLAAHGVEAVVTARPLEGSGPVLADLVERVARLDDPAGPSYLHRLRRPAPSVLVTARVREAATLDQALALLLDPDFDPRREAVLAGRAQAGRGPDSGRADGGVARVAAESRSRIVLEVEAATPALVAIQRSHLRLYRALVDGAEVPLRVVNLSRIGVEVPAGRHRVVVEIDVAPVVRSLAGPLLALILVLWWRRRR